MASADNGKAEIYSPDAKSPAAAELSAPPGWTKKLIPTKGRNPRNEVVFISPAGEEMKNKRQLDQYLRSHPGGPSPSEFDWGAGDTPRRSARLSEKVKATETPESEPPKKRERISSLKEASKEVGGDIEDEALEKETIVAESKDHADTEMTEVDDGMKKKDEDTLSEAFNAASVEKNLKNETEKVAEIDQTSAGEPKEEVHDDGKNVNSSNKKEAEDGENNKYVPKEEEVITEKKNADEPKEEVHDDEKNVNSSNKKEAEDGKNNKCVPKEEEVITEKKNADEPKEKVHEDGKNVNSSNKKEAEDGENNKYVPKVEEVITEKKNADEPKEEAGTEEKNGDESNEGQVNSQDRPLEIMKEDELEKEEKNLEANKVGPVQSALEADKAKEEAGKEEPSNSELRGPISMHMEDASAENAVKYEEIKSVVNHNLEDECSITKEAHSAN